MGLQILMTFLELWVLRHWPLILLMKFKKFQDVEGVIRLPGSFKPNRMIVEIKPNNNKLSPVKQRFKWTIASRGDS